LPTPRSSDLIDKDTVIIKGKSYNKNDPNIIQDYFTGKYVHIAYANLINICIGLQALNLPDPNIEFKPDNVNTWEQYSKIEKFIDLSDPESFEKFHNTNLYIRVVINMLGEFNFYTNNPDEVITRYNLVKGKNNSGVYFTKRELKYMDKPLPYQKFDNIYFKQDIET